MKAFQCIGLFQNSPRKSLNCLSLNHLPTRLCPFPFVKSSFRLPSLFFQLLPFLWVLFSSYRVRSKVFTRLQFGKGINFLTSEVYSMRYYLDALREETLGMSTH